MRRDEVALLNAKIKVQNKKLSELQSIVEEQGNKLNNLASLVRHTVTEL